jgi:hypothetical protein
MIRSTSARRLAFVIPAVLLLSCFERPVRESLFLRFLPDNAVMVGVTVALGDESAFAENRAARERLDALRRDLESGRDDWARRIESVEPAFERTALEKEKGKIRRVSRKIALEDARDLRRYFSDTLLQTQFTPADEESQLTIIVQPGSRASRAQREEFQQRLDAWSASFARYLADVAELYAYLDQHPSRARACLGSVFAGDLDPEEARSLEPLNPSEKQLTEALGDSLQRTLELFTPDGDSAYSLQELSELAWNPLPASLAIEVPGPILEQQGFVEQGNRILTVKEPGLWQALQALGARWVKPDLLSLKYRALATGKPLKAADLVRMERGASAPPSPAGILRELEQAIPRPAGFRVRWSTRNLKAPESEHELEEIWRTPDLSRD